MRGLRKLLLFMAICASLGLASSAGAVIKLDVGPGTSATQAGWTAISQYNDYAHAPGGSYLGPVALGGGVTAGFYNTFNVGTTDRGAAAIAASPLHALGLDELLRDYGMFSTAGSTYSLLVKGLTPGDYNVTVYSADPSYPNETRAVAVQGVAVTFDPFGTTPTLDKIAKTVTVTVSATGELAITRPVGASAPCKFNGVVVEPVPEPVTLVMLASGIGLLVLRRRG
jgi:hypothetical protein